ncbi:MAG: tRNA uridine-5-carboxymethylaminomethyl(34) synthesis GTPase MnmE [Elusimicrobia bacterium]|nr:tRNA uridine-5-carboxymethylaminomethyl(34) synthesis GTPase MnmE [Candidatus Liberimonas magnetica]
MYQNSTDTITAISTPLGQSGLGVIRLSGPDAVRIIESFFKPAADKPAVDNPIFAARSHTLHYGFIRDKERLIDEVVVAVFKAPHSYTGEDIIEISAHGGPIVLKEILALCLANGARLAAPGEFSFRAFVNGRMDLTKAEAVQDLIASKTVLAAQASINQLKGSLFEKISSWRKKIIGLLSDIEASLDHCEEEIKFITDKEIAAVIKYLIQEINVIEKSALKESYLRDGLKVSIIGKPNAGKSSIFNVLLEKERAIVTEYPGTTRDTIEETIDLKGIPVVITDMAGLREKAPDPAERIGQERAKDCIKLADMVLWILDSSTELGPEDKYIWDILSPLKDKKSVVPVLNKTDLPLKLDETELKKIFCREMKVIKLSALKKSGFEQIEEAILANFKKDNNLADEPFLLNERHLDALRSAKSDLNTALTSVNTGESEELIAFNLREALNHLGEISGENITDEILENIFSKFCLGK